MDINKIREQIDKTDDEILKLFIERMNLCGEIADYKRENGLSVTQKEREQEVLSRVAKATPDELKAASELLFKKVMDISKCLQCQRNTDTDEFSCLPLKQKEVVLACAGATKSNTELACHKLFEDKQIRFYSDFSDVFSAVEKGEADYGVLPIGNRSVGEAFQIYRLLSKYDFYICKSAAIKVPYCLAAKKGTTEIMSIYSHEQALMQCSEHIRQQKGAKAYSCQNTALAAMMVRDSDDMTMAAICSPECAAYYGLEIIDGNVADNPDNATGFICISKKPEIEENADIISICIAIPDEVGSLSRLLTRFAYLGLNISRVESVPAPKGLHDVKGDILSGIVYIDFEGNINNPSVNRLLVDLKNEMKYYRFLGNYRHVD